MDFKSPKRQDSKDSVSSEASTDGLLILPTKPSTTCTALARNDGDMLPTSSWSASADTNERLQPSSAHQAPAEYHEYLLPSTSYSASANNDIPFLPRPTYTAPANHSGSTDPCCRCVAPADPCVQFSTHKYLLHISEQQRRSHPETNACRAEWNHLHRTRDD